MMMEFDFQGPSSNKEMARIVIRGNSYERGVQYGRELKRYLQDFYYWFVKAEPRDVLTCEYCAALEKTEETTYKYFPQLIEQIKGWSDGAEMEYDKCRILAFHNDIKRLGYGCSNVAVTECADGAWIGRNCDLFENERSWQIFVKAYCDDCYSYAGTGYVGLPGSIGVNCEGLAIGGASLPPVKPICNMENGLGNYVYYLLLTRDSVENSRKAIETIPNFCGGIHILMLDSRGACLAAELGGGQLYFREPDENGVLIATSHSVTGKMKLSDTFAGNTKAVRDKIENSKARYARLTELISNVAAENRTVELARKALGDHCGKWPVCRHEPNGFHTIYSWIIQPGRGRSRMYLCWGYPCSNAYELIEIDF